MSWHATHMHPFSKNREQNFHLLTLKMERETVQSEVLLGVSVQSKSSMLESFCLNMNLGEESSSSPNFFSLLLNVKLFSQVSRPCFLIQFTLSCAAVCL